MSSSLLLNSYYDVIQQNRICYFFLQLDIHVINRGRNSFSGIPFSLDFFFFFCRKPVSNHSLLFKHNVEVCLLVFSFEKILNEEFCTVLELSHSFNTFVNLTTNFINAVQCLLVHWQSSSEQRLLHMYSALHNSTMF